MSNIVYMRFRLDSIVETIGEGGMREYRTDLKAIKRRHKKFSERKQALREAFGECSERYTPLCCSDFLPDDNGPNQAG